MKNIFLSLGFGYLAWRASHAFPLDFERAVDGIVFAALFWYHWHQAADWVVAKTRSKQ